ncbi:MAG: hypothetical protein WAR77_15505, partial [Saprospiraceae bacterium]
MYKITRNFKIDCKKHIIKILQLAFVLFSYEVSFSQCAGLDADAGPDMWQCEPGQLIQLQGSVQGNYTKIYWTPVFGLSDPNILDPIVSIKNPGKYTFKLTAEGLSTINLIVNSDFDAGNTGFVSNYVYNTINITEGEYFVTANPSSWNGGFSPCGDHTSGSGNMLLLNGSPVANTNFWCQTIPTVIGRRYQFEFWSQSVVGSNIAQLNVKLNGTSIGTTQAGGLCNWERFVVNFIATTTNSQLCISETTGIRGGNDFAVDDITLYETCMDMDEVMVEIVNLVAKIDIPIQAKCSSDPFDLTALGSSTGPNIRYVWSTDVGVILSQNGLIAKAKGSGIYTVKVIYTNGNVICEQEASIEYIAPEILSGTIEVNEKINCRQDSILLKATIVTGSGLYSFKWAPDSLILSGQNTDSIFIKKARKYFVTITDQNSGCKLSLDYDVLSDTLKPLAKIIGDTLLNCITSNVILKSSLTDSLKYNIRWVTPDKKILTNKSSILDSVSGVYKLFILDTRNHCQDSASWNVYLDTIHPLIDLGLNQIIDCLNDGVIITNQLQNSSPEFSYIWTINNFVFAKKSTLIDQNIANASNIKLQILNESNGCEVTDSLIVTDIRSIPFLDAGNSELLTCINTSVKLQARINLTDTLQIVWSTLFGNILSGSNTLEPIVNQKAWYFIHIMNPTNGCENEDSIFVDENIVPPNAMLGPDLSFSCIDSVKTIDASNSSAGNSIRYLWSSLDGSIKSGLGTNKMEADKPGKYQLIVLDTLNGCSDTASINIFPDTNKPIVSVATPDTLNCLVTEITLLGSAFSQSGNPLQFHWTNSLGTGIQSPDSLSTKIQLPGSYFFTAVDKINGCSTTVQTFVRIDTLKPVIDAGVDLVWNCNTNQIILEGLVSGNRNSFEFNWITNDGSILSNPNQQKVAINTPGGYFFKVLNLWNGCSSSDTILIIPDLVKPVISIQKPDTLSCYNPSIQINTIGSSIGNRFSALWTRMNGTIPGNPMANTIIVDQPGLYFFRILDTINKCFEADSVWVIENKIHPEITIQIPDELNCSRKTIELHSSIQNGGNNLLIYWSSATAQILSSNSQLICVVDKAAKYILKVQNLENGCTDIDSIEVFENLNIPTDFNYTIQQPKCFNEKGSILINQIIGGQSPFMYFLDGTLVNGNAINNLSSG